MTRKTTQLLRIGLITLAAGAAINLPGAAVAETFSLDDNPSAPLTSPFVPPFLSAEDPYGMGLPASLAGLLGPSPTLIAGPWLDADLLKPRPGGPVPQLDVRAIELFYLNAVSGNHADVDEFWEEITLRFSVSRETTGMPGTASFKQAMLNQQPGDIFETDMLFPNPAIFVGTLGGGPFAGILPSAGFGGGNVLHLDESMLQLTAGIGPGGHIPPNEEAPPIDNGTHDNVDAYNEIPVRQLDWNEDFITDYSFYFSVPIAETTITGLLPADIYDVIPGAPLFPIGAPPFAFAAQMGLGQFGEVEDDIDALVVWDRGERHGPAWGGPGAEPGIDFALFSLAPGSATLGALGLSAGTVFFTDFTGAFAVYAFEKDLGLDSRFGVEWANVDALEIAEGIPGGCVGDLDGDGDTDLADLGILLASYGVDGGGDLDGDGDTDLSDLGILLADYGCV
jgi:hypothetical protein